MKTILFAGQSMRLDASGILFWPEHQIAVVADLHLEKATYFARHGQLLPPQESYHTLFKLQNVLSRVSCRSLILLGDSFHDANGFARLNAPARHLWDQLRARYTVTFVRGNHDGAVVPPHCHGRDYLEWAGIHFRHQARLEAVAEISGHYHPKACLRLHGSRITRPCFIVDTKRMILPAFGSLTGGMDVRSEAISNLFASESVVHLLGEHTIYSVPLNKLAGSKRPEHRSN